MFIAALFTVVKIWKQPKCPSADKWIGISLAIQWLRLHASNAGWAGLIPGRTNIPHATQSINK